jgi:hypothetical protein
MEWSGDDLAGIVAIFDALPRETLVEAAAELAFKQGDTPDEDAISDAIGRAIDEYRLVAVDGRLVPGPTAYATPPAGAEDLPHILDPDPGELAPPDPGAVASTVEETFRADAASAAASGDPAEVERLLDLSYGIESTVDIDLGEARERLTDATSGD